MEQEELVFEPQEEEEKKSAGKVIPQRMKTHGSEPIVLSTPPPIMKGFLYKQGQEFKSWKRRYFVLDKGHLSYYEKELKEPPFGLNKKGEVIMKFMKCVEKGTIVTVTSEGKGDRDLVLDIRQFNERGLWIKALRSHADYYFKDK